MYYHLVDCCYKAFCRFVLEWLYLDVACEGVDCQYGFAVTFRRLWHVRDYVDSPCSSRGLNYGDFFEFLVPLSGLVDPAQVTVCDQFVHSDIEGARRHEKSLFHVPLNSGCCVMCAQYCVMSCVYETVQKYLG